MRGDSDEGEGLSESDREPPAPAPEPKDSDLFSLSAYTEDLMSSRMNVLQQTTAGTWNERLGLNGNSFVASPRPSSIDQPSATAPGTSNNHEKSGQHPTWIWVNVKEKGTSEEHEFAEMIFNAWHNLMRGVLEHFRRDTSTIKARQAGLSVLKPTYQPQTLMRRIRDKMRSAVERE